MADAGPYRYGTYYAEPQEDGAFLVVRLLTMGNYGVHWAMFNEKFTNIPTVTDIEGKTPFIGHVPQDIKSIFHRRNTPIYHQNLRVEDLEGFAYYLKDMGATDQEVKGELASIVEFSASGNGLSAQLLEDGRVSFQVVPSVSSSSSTMVR